MGLAIEVLGRPGNCAYFPENGAHSALPGRAFLQWPAQTSRLVVGERWRLHKNGGGDAMSVLLARLRPAYSTEKVANVITRVHPHITQHSPCAMSVCQLSCCERDAQEARRASKLKVRGRGGGGKKGKGCHTAAYRRSRFVRSLSLNSPIILPSPLLPALRHPPGNPPEGGPHDARGEAAPGRAAAHTRGGGGACSAGRARGPRCCPRLGG